MKRAIIQNYEKAKAKVKTNSTSRGLFLFVAIPTLIAAFYYYAIAADIYVSETKFSVNVEGSHAGMSPLGMLLPSLGASSNIQEAIIVREYISSRAMLESLIKSVDIKSIYNNPKADFLSKIPSDLKVENYLVSYQDKVKVLLDEVTGITTLRVGSFDPDDSKKVAEAVLSEAESFVNRMARRVQEDSIAFSKAEVKKSEAMVLEISSRITNFRNENKNFDPTVTTTSVLGITSSLEGELAKTKSEIANLLNYMKADSAKVVGLQAKARALQQQIDEQSGRLASETGSTLADLTEQYAALNMEREFALKRLEVSLSSLEAAQAEARKKSKYLLRIVEPTLPEEALEPRRLMEVLTVFFACLISYTLGGLIIAAIKDHVRP